MDQRISSKGSMVGAAISLFAGIAMLPVGIGMLASYPDRIWPLGLLLVVPGGVIIYFSILTLRKGEKELKQSALTEKTLKKKAVAYLKAVPEKASTPVSAAAPSPSLPSTPSLSVPADSDEPLAVWTCTEEEWKQFYQWEIQDRKLQAWATGLVVTFLGGLFIMFLRQAAWYVAFPIAGFIGAVYGVLSFHLFIASLGKTKGSASLIIFTENAVMINNAINPFRNDMYRLGGVTINDKQDLRVMLIEFHWSSARAGAQSDEIHIPIPKGKLGDAIRLMDHYNASINKEKLNGSIQ